MLKINKTVLPSKEQWEIIIEGMRNPMNSWHISDSFKCEEQPYCYAPNCYQCIGKNDHDLMTKLAAGGSVHAKYRRMIPVWFTVTAPLYWWKEFDTYKVGTVANSCSTMHKIHSKEFTLDDFSHERLDPFALNVLHLVIKNLNTNRNLFISEGNKQHWENMIQLLPSSYNQKRTIMLNYEVLVGIYRDRKNHKLDEWHVFCDWIRSLPYSELITGGAEDE